MINPLIMKKYTTTAIRKGKTDKLDSIKISNYGVDNWFKLEKYQPIESAYDELRMLGRQYSHYIKIKVEGTLSLTNILDRVMPGIKQFLQNRSDIPTKDKLLDFVEEYWHYENILHIGESKFLEDYCRWAKEKGYHASKSKAKLIYQMSDTSILTLSSNNPSTKMLTLEAVRILHEMNKTLYAILTQI